jgi:hypothetical protein
MAISSPLLSANQRIYLDLLFRRLRDGNCERQNKVAVAQKGLILAQYKPLATGS